MALELIVVLALEAGTAPGETGSGRNRDIGTPQKTPASLRSASRLRAAASVGNSVYATWHTLASTASIAPEAITRSGDDAWSAMTAR